MDSRPPSVRHASSGESGGGGAESIKPVRTWSSELAVQDRAEDLRRVSESVIADMNAHGYAQASQFAVRVALEESILNALRHGHRDLPGQPVDVRWSVDPKRIVIQVQDHGPGFDRSLVPDPTLPDRLELPSGRGIMLIEAYMTRVEFTDRCRCITMEYVRPVPPGRQN